MFWQFFVVSDMLTVGYVTTIAHWLFVAGHLVVLATPPATADASRAFQ